MLTVPSVVHHGNGWSVHTVMGGHQARRNGAPGLCGDAYSVANARGSLSAPSMVTATNRMTKPWVWYSSGGSCWYASGATIPMQHSSSAVYLPTGCPKMRSLPGASTPKLASAVGQVAVLVLKHGIRTRHETLASAINGWFRQAGIWVPPPRSDIRTMVKLTVLAGISDSHPTAVVCMAQSDVFTGDIVFGKKSACMEDGDGDCLLKVNSDGSQFVASESHFVGIAMTSAKANARVTVGVSGTFSTHAAFSGDEPTPGKYLTLATNSSSEPWSNRPKGWVPVNVASTTDRTPLRYSALDNGPDADGDNKTFRVHVCKQHLFPQTSKYPEPTNVAAAAGAAAGTAAGTAAGGGGGGGGLAAAAAAAFNTVVTAGKTAATDSKASAEKLGPIVTMIDLEYTLAARELNKKGGTTTFLELGAMLAACSDSVQAFTDASSKLNDADPVVQGEGLADLQNAQKISNELHATVNLVAYQAAQNVITMGNAVKSTLTGRTYADDLMTALSTWQLKPAGGDKNALADLLPLKPSEYEFLCEGWPDQQLRKKAGKYAQSWKDFIEYVLDPAGALNAAWSALDITAGAFLLGGLLTISQLESMAATIGAVTTATKADVLAGAWKMEGALSTVLMSFLYAIQRYAKIGSTKANLQANAVLAVHSTSGGSAVIELKEDDLADCFKDMYDGIQSLWPVLGIDTTDLPAMEVTANNKTPPPASAV